MPNQGAISLIWEEKKNSFKAGFGEIPRLKVGSGNVVDQDGKNLGRWLEVQILSYNEVFVISPCDKNAPSELVRYSYSNITFDDGTGDSVAEYLADLKTNWPDSACKRYYEVIALLRASEMSSDYMNELVQIQLSPTSVTAFEGYRKQTSFKLALGQVSAENVDLCRFEACSVTVNKNTWTKLIAKAAQL